MALRIWIIRGVILTVLSGVGYGLWWAQSYVSPEAVRASLLSTLAEQFPDTEITVGSAHIRVFGGISIRNLSLTRTGEDHPFFQAQSGTIYHDKEQINRGRLAIRKVELDSPVLTIVRKKDGNWSIQGLKDDLHTNEPVPTIVIQKARIILRDESDQHWPTIILNDTNLTIVNDPAPHYLVAKISATAVLGQGYTTPFHASARIHRGTGRIELRTEFPDLIIGESLSQLVQQFDPGISSLLTASSGKLDLRAQVTYCRELPLDYDATATIRELNFAHDWLPDRVTCSSGRVRVRNGMVTIEQLVARMGQAELKLSLQTRTPVIPPIPGNESVTNPAVLVSRTKSPAPARSFEWEEDLERIDLSLERITIDDHFFRRLPARFQKLQEVFAPEGRLGLLYQFQRSDAENWKRVFEIQPEKLKAVYEKFRYPLTDLAGKIRQTTSPESDSAVIDLTALASGQPITLKGTVRGAGPDPEITLRIHGTGVPIDDTLAQALPNRKDSQMLQAIHAKGRGDFVVEVKQEAGRNLLENTVQIEVYDVAICHKAFPYPLENVRGKINIYVTVNDSARPIRPGEAIGPLPDNDRMELREITARHGSGTIWIKGDNDPIPNSRDRKMTLNVWGKDCPIDETFHEALAALKLNVVSDVLQPKGQLSFAVDVEILDRFERSSPRTTMGPAMRQNAIEPLGQLTALARPVESTSFDPESDLKLAFTFEGPTITPKFFPYQMDATSGRLKFDGSLVKLERLTARHGVSALALNAAEIRFYEDGRIWANLGKIDVAPLVVDDELIAALPRGLRRGVNEINLRGPAELSLKHMVLLTPRSDYPDSQLDPEVYWNGEIKLDGAAFESGVSCENAFGRFACTGSYLPTHLGKVNGNLWLDSALIASHPATRIKATFDADPQEADPLRPGEWLPPAFKFQNIQGQLFQGMIGGSARVVLSDPVRYRLALTATNVRLEDLARHHKLGNGAKMEGTAQASLLLETSVIPGTSEQILTGYGKADVDRGQIYNLPPLVPLLKALKLQAPDKKAFEEAHAVFTIRGDRILVDHVDLLGTAISLGGAGELDMQGQYVKFDFYTIWSQTLQRWLTTPFGDLTAMVSEKLFKIEVTRKPNGEMKYEPRPVPIVTDPFKAIVERIKKRAARTPAAKSVAVRSDP